MLLEAGARPDLTNQSGELPWHLARNNDALQNTRALSPPRFRLWFSRVARFTHTLLSQRQ